MAPVDDGSAPMARLSAGSSGFSYATWKPDFYPAGTKANEFLRVYAERLSSVELNATFYRLPSEDQLRDWAAQTPECFQFAVKMSRQITHFGRVDGIGTFCERVRALGDRLGPILVQLPPTRPRDDGLLRLFLDSVDPEYVVRLAAYVSVEELLIGRISSEPKPTSLTSPVDSA